MSSPTRSLRSFGGSRQSRGVPYLSQGKYLVEEKKAYPPSVYRQVTMIPEVNESEKQTNSFAPTKDSSSGKSAEGSFPNWVPVPPDVTNPIEEPTNDSNFHNRFDRMQFSLVYLNENFSHLTRKPKDLVFDITLYRYLCSSAHSKTREMCVKAKQFAIQNGLCAVIQKLWTEFLGISESHHWLRVQAEHLEILYQLLMTAWFVSSSDQFRVAIGAKLSETLTQFMAADIFNKSMRDVKRAWDCLKAVLGCLYQFARVNELRKTLRDLGLVESMKKLEQHISANSYMKARTAFLMAYLLSEEELKQEKSTKQLIKFFGHSLRNCLKNPNHRNDKFNMNALEILECLNSLAVSDPTKKAIFYAPELMQNNETLLKEGSSAEQEMVCKLIWQLCFDKELAQNIVGMEGIKASLRTLARSPHDELKTSAGGCLWTMDSINKRLAIAASVKNGGHIMISYQWDVQRKAKLLKTKLQERGYRVWIDIDNMSGSTLSAMSEAVENSCFVLIMFSEQYLRSPACRCEAEYSFKLQKEMVPIRTQPDYVPDGWLGMMLGVKSFLEMVDEAHLESSLVPELESIFGDICQGEPLVSQEKSIIPGKEKIPASPTQNQSPLQDNSAFIREPSCKEWSATRVNKWASEQNITHIFTKIENDGVIDGKILAEMRIMQQLEFKYFCDSVKEEYGVTFYDVLQLNSCLRCLD